MLRAVRRQQKMRRLDRKYRELGLQRKQERPQVKGAK